MDIADRLAILDLVHRYGHSYDEGHVEDMGQLFTEDGEFEIRGGIGGMPDVMRGREEIVAHMGARRAATQPAQRRHLTTNVIIDEDGADAARTACYLLLGTTTDGTLSLPITGRYTDEVVREADATWRFRRRVLTLDGSLG